MSFFAKGSFKLEESWEQKQKKKQQPRGSNSRNKSREKEQRQSLVNAGKNILAELSTDMLDDELSKKILRELSQEMPPLPSSIKADKKGFSKEEAIKRMPPKQKVQSGPQGQGDLLTAMAGRLKGVEVTCKNQRQQIRQKTETIERLKEENLFLKGFKEDSSKEYEKMKDLQNENGELQQKVVEMEAYLKKYGLKWVGNKIEGKLEHEKMKKDIKPSNQYRLPSEIDINTILRRVEELNSGLHSEGMGTEVYEEKGVHKFRKADPLSLGFFSNGLAIKGYRFFPYKSKESLQILGDLVDGYFPYVLKGKYPNGVFLRVFDKVAEKYNDQSSGESITTFESSENNDFRPPSKEQFLSKLPKQVVKNGKIINIRSEIEKKFNGQENPSIDQAAEVEENQEYSKDQGVIVFKTAQNQQLRDGLATEMEFCTLKIRNEQGQVFILHLSKEQRMGQIYCWMRKVIKHSFVLMSNFPRRRYDTDQAQDLETLGFFPNAMLHIHSDK